MGHPAMTILYPALSPVKPARRFGAGLLASRPAYRAPYTEADLAWLAADDARREDEHFDRMAEDSTALDRVSLGYC